MGKHQSDCSPFPRRSSVQKKFSLSQGGKLLQKWWQARHVVDMKVEGGKRFWLIAWDGDNGAGNAWKDSWEPTSHVSADLMAEFMMWRKALAASLVPIDLRALHSVIVRTVAGIVMDCDGTGAFGHHVVRSLDILKLGALADYYIDSVAGRFELEPCVVYDPKSKRTTKELRISVQEQVGDYCDFKKYMPRAGSKSLRLFCGRKCLHSMAAVAVLKLRYTDILGMPGEVASEVEIETVYINGATGELVPPHQVRGLLGSDAFKTDPYPVPVGPLVSRFADSARSLRWSSSAALMFIKLGGGPEGT